MEEKNTTKILVLGATGYVGGRLVPLLLSRGYTVRVLARDTRKVKSRAWADHANLEIFQGNVHDKESIEKALEGVSIVYYLVHSMVDTHDFSQADRDAAYTVALALKNSGAQRVIYLSGIEPEDPLISQHLKSRAEVGRILELAGVPMTILRASQILGVGSASFEMVRYLVDRLPFMLAPRWINTKTQPISMSNVLEYLAGVLEHPETASQTYDIGGPSIVSYRELMDAYADAAGLPHRKMLLVPGFPLGMYSYLVGLATPVPPSLARALVEGLRNEVICKDTRIRKIIPQDLLTVPQAMARAVGRVRRNDVDTSWSDAGLPIVPEWVVAGDPAYAGGSLHTDAFSMRLLAKPEDLWDAIIRIGGEHGWYSNNLLWKTRGLMDRAMGGPGTQRGRRHSDELNIGDGLDFWRVLDIQKNHRLLLITEMRMPGEGLLDISLCPVTQQETDLTISLYFRPRGASGLAYWYAVLPFHYIAFTSMLKAIAAEVEKPIILKPHKVTALSLSRAFSDTPPDPLEELQAQTCDAQKNTDTPEK